MEAPCRKAPVATVASWRHFLAGCLILLLASSQVSAQDVAPPFTLQPATVTYQHSAGTIFQLQLTTTEAATLSLVATSFSLADVMGLFEITSGNLLRSTRALQIAQGLTAVDVTATSNSSGAVSRQIYFIEVVAYVRGIPIFTNLTIPDGYEASIPENAATGTVLRSIDVKVPGRGAATLSFIPASAIFNFQGRDVILSTDRVLDRETKDLYNLTVQARNGNESSYTQLFINITDVNDNPPIIPPRQVGYIYITNPPGTRVTGFLATDIDIGMNNETSFYIVSGNVDNAFRIDQDSGEVFTTKPLATLPYTINMTIRVEDNGSPKLEAIGNLTILILIANNTAPEFINDPYSVTINESTAVGSRIFRVLANDTDLNVAGIITYALVMVPSSNGMPVFSIDADSGWIMLAQPLDFEAQSSFTFNITATDQHRVRPQSAMTTITVGVSDVNDNPPVFSMPNYRIDLAENTLVDQLVFDLGTRVNDSDSEVNKLFTFHVYPQSDPAYRVDSDTGRVYLNQTLSRQGQPNHVVYVFAEDMGTPALRGNATIYIQVLEVNDFVPQINIPASIDVFETNGTAVNVPFYDINVTDGDGGPAGNVTLTIISQSGSLLFGVEPYTHGLFYTRVLDYESATVRSWTIVLLARDAGDPQFSSSKTLMIKLEDWNEYAPVFTSTRYEGGVDLSTTTPVGTALVQVSATDQDGFYNTLTYSITAGQSNREFTINSATGLIANGAFAIVQTQNFTLTVTATDNGIPFRLNTSTQVEIRVLRSENVNDPVFNRAIYNFTINETAPIGTTIVQLNATDRDAGDAGEIRYIQQTAKSQFEVDELTGIITTKVAFDYDVGPIVFEIIVQARDRGAFRPRTSPIPATVEVHIQNTNDHPPVFILSPYVVMISENTAVNTSLAVRVHATDADGTAHRSGIVRYSIAQGPGSTDFRIDNVTGILYVNRMLNFENISAYSLVIVATDGDITPMNATAIYNITITDFNDNPPKIFAPADTTVYVDEEVMIGSDVTTVKASDIDSGLNGKISYSIEPTLSNIFSINATSGELTTAARLNRESGTVSFNVTVYARDGGSPQREDSVVLTILINDINDVSPVFSASGIYTAPVLESVPNGQIVAIVQATDGDSDPANKVITYGIYGGTGQNLFTINSTTGEIKKSGHLDFETAKNYSLLVNCTDGRFVAYATVTIRVTDVNDNNPYFNQSIYTASALENSAADTSLLQVFVLDPDTLQDDIGVSYTLVSTGQPFAVGATTGEVTVNGPLDYDLLPRSYDLIVACHPLANTSVVYNRTTVRISLLPENDNSPVFMPPAVAVSLAENQPAQIIATRSAQDADLPSQNITYYVVILFSDGVPTATLASLFSLNATSGVVATTGPLDREVFTAPVYMTTEASDGGTPPRTGVGLLAVTVTDVRDVAPVFIQSTYRLSVNENTGLSVISTLSAADKDEVDTVNYAIANTAASQYFSIGKFNGQLSLVQMLNREVQDRWIFNVTASDLNSAVGYATVNVTVTDYNDRPPEFLDAANYSVSIAEDSSVGLPIGIQLRASDDDIGSNAEFEFSLSGGAGSSDFAVDPTSGVMSIRRQLDRERQGFYSLQVTVTDFGTPQLSTSTLVNITIIDVNDNTPVMNATVYVGYIDEDSAIGSPVLTFPSGMQLEVAASDRDQPGNNNSILRYYFDLPQSVPFVVNNVTGAIYSSGSLDRESHPEPYLVQVRARDLVGSGRGRLSIPSLINITLIDTDDSPPVFSQAAYAATVIENAPNGMSLVRVSSSDADLGSNRYVQYEIIAGNSDSAFTINSSTGIVYKNGTLDFESARLYTLTVKAVDVSNRILTDTVNITITVTDFNNRSPVFYPDGDYRISIDETNNTDFFILQVFANDTDLAGSNNVIIRYRLIDSFGGTFKLDPVSGVLRTASTIDFDVLPMGMKYFRIPIQAYDLGQTSLETNANVTVTIEDVNDNYPIFSPATYSVNVRENLEMGMSVLQVFATDLDSAQNGEVSFWLSESGNTDSTFVINRTTGVVELNTSLNFETQKTFSLSVTARDSGNPMRQNSADVVINIVNVNDNAPIFALGEYTAVVMESTAVNTPILTVFASDRDSGNHSAIVYSLQGPAQSTFAVNSTTGVLTLELTLDYDLGTRTYRLVVLAQDFSGVGSGILTGSSNITITVSDSNDIAPEFNQTLYTTEVAENVTIGTTVYMFRPRVYDGDTAAANKRLVYSLLPDGTFGRFLVDPLSGAVITTDVLTSSSRDFYNMTVVVTDGVHTRTARFEVLVDVGPTFVQAAYTAVVLENFTVGDTIISVSATEESWDTEGSTSSISYYIRSGNSDGLFMLDPATGNLLLARSLNFEVDMLHILNVQAVDSDGRMSNLVTVTITVRNVNEFAPVFESVSYPGVTFMPATALQGAIYDVTVAEGRSTPEDTKIAQVAASDADAASNGAISFALVGGNIEQRFYLTGADIFLNASLDFEGTKIFRLNISASDNSVENGLVTYAIVRVTVSDVNDNAPIFSQPQYNVSVAEEVPVTFITVVTATDQDSGQNKRIVYSILGPNFGVFTINSSTGVLTVLALDREKNDFYQLVIEATDSSPSGIQESTTSLLQVTVVDANDNPPVFSFPTGLVTFSELEMAGYVLTTVRASDSDQGTNSDLTFSIAAVSPTNARGVFEVNGTTGALQLSRAVDYDAMPPIHDFNVTIMATDGGVAPSQSANLVVRLRVIDANDNLPQFNQSLYTNDHPPVFTLSPYGVEDNVPVIQPGILHGYINENSPLGTPVLDTSSGQPLAVVASNTDASGSGGGSGSGACAVHFSINLAQSVPFEIDATTGNIYSSGSLDWEAHPKPYLVQVRARYLAGTGLFSNPALINISLVNVYDDEYCRVDTTTNFHGTFVWNLTLARENRTLPCPVQTGSNDTMMYEYAIRFCNGSSPGKGNIWTWSEPDTHRCPFLSSTTRALQQLSTAFGDGDDINTAISTVEIVVNLTQNASGLTTVDVDITSIILQNVVSVTANATLDSNITVTISHNFFIIVDNILDTSGNYIQQAPAMRIAQAAEALFQILPLPVNFTAKQSGRNIGSARSCPSQISNQFIDANIVRSQVALSIDSIAVPTNLTDVSHLLSFAVTEEVFRRASVNPASAEDDELCSLPQTGYVAYRNVKLFNDPSLGNQTTLASSVFLAQVGTTDISNLTSKITAVFNTSQSLATTGVQYECVFWNYTRGGWSGDGCEFISATAAGQVTCKCSHLTNFAVLVSYRNKDTPRALSIVTYIGCGLSLAALAVTIVTIVSIRKLRQTKHFQLMWALSTTLLLLVAVFLSGTERRSKSEGLCLAFALVTHYLLLSVFCWMSSIATLLYIQLVKVFGGVTGRVMKILIVMSLGLPLLIVVITASATSFSAYTTERTCWMSSLNAFIGSVYVPMAISLIYNCIILGTVVYSIRRRKQAAMVPAGSSNQQAVRIFFLLSCLVGVTWTSSIFVIIFDNIIPQYIFAVLNTLQGVFILIFHIIRSEHVKDAWSSTFRSSSRPSKSSKPSKPSKPLELKVSTGTTDPSSSFLSLSTKETTLNHTIVRNNMYLPSPSTQSPM